MSVKGELRKSLIIKRRNVLNKADKDKIICDKLIGLDEYKQASLVLLYAALEDEINIDSVIEYSLSVGKSVALPRCTDNKGNMTFCFINSLDELEHGHFGVREPLITSKEVTDFSHSICIVPALSFDKLNYRIGYGKGYYDRFLEKYNCFSVGLCYNELIEEKLPIDIYDKAVDLVLTD